jgi:sterol 3beta-glucosyltransferase
VNDFRHFLKLPLLHRSIFDKAASDRILTGSAVSPALLPRPGDWHMNIQVTGFLQLPPHPETERVPERAPDNPSETLPETLMHWLQAGTPPIYIGFGSMPISDPVLFIRVLRERLTRTNHRFILCTGWTALPDCPTNSRLFVVPSINHEWLLPQCKTAVIHGGAGTLAATLKAGTPPVIVSIFGDQHWWGKYIEKKGLGRHVPFKKLSPNKIIAALQTLGSLKITQNVSTLARQLQREDGLQNAITNLEQYFR